MVIKNQTLFVTQFENPCLKNPRNWKHFQEFYRAMKEFVNVGWLKVKTNDKFFML